MSLIFPSIDILNNVYGTGIKERMPVDTCSIVNVDLTTNLVGATIGGVTITANMRILLAGQTVPSANGVYFVVAGAGATIRDSDYYSGDVSQTFLTVKAYTGSLFGMTVWQATATPPGSVTGTAVVGTDNLNFAMKENLNYGTGTLFYGNTVTSPYNINTISTLSAPATTSFLQMTSAGVPSWSQPTNLLTAGNGIIFSGVNNDTISTNLLLNGGIEYNSGQMYVALSDTSINGTLSIAHGGTGVVTLPAGILIGAGTSAITAIASSSSKVVVCGSTGVFGTSNIVNVSQINSAANNEIITFTDGSGTPVNYLNITSAATTLTPSIATLGTDTNIGLSFLAKGTGNYNFGSSSASPTILNLFASTYTYSLTTPTLTGALNLTLPATAGSSGYVMTTNGSGTLSFSPTRINFNLVQNQVSVSSSVSTNFGTVIGYFPYLGTRYGGIGTTGSIIFDIVGLVASSSITVTVADATTPGSFTSLGAATYSGTASNGIQQLAFTTATANFLMGICIYKSTTPVFTPSVYGINIAIN